MDVLVSTFLELSFQVIYDDGELMLGVDERKRASRGGGFVGLGGVFTVPLSLVTTGGWLIYAWEADSWLSFTRLAIGEASVICASGMASLCSRCCVV